jgi:hypothetical protein
MNLFHTIAVSIPCFLLVEYVAFWFPKTMVGVLGLLVLHFHFPKATGEILQYESDEITAPQPASSQEKKFGVPLVWVT